MLEARVAKARIRGISINCRGEIEEEDAGLATWLPVPAGLGSAINDATFALIRWNLTSLPISDE